MRPIQRRLLIHSAVLTTSETTDAWGNGTSPVNVNLTNVRFNPTNKLVQTSTNQEVQLTNIMFFDIYHSRPIGTTFDYDMKLTFNNNEHRIITIEPIHDDKGLHHYELGLI